MSSKSDLNRSAILHDSPGGRSKRLTDGRRALNAASNAGKVLSDPQSTKKEKSAAASALSQRASKKKGH